MSENRKDKDHRDCRARDLVPSSEPLERGRMLNPCNGSLIGMAVEEGHELIARLMPLGYKWKPANCGRAATQMSAPNAGELLDPQGEHAGECWSGKMWLPARTVAVVLPLLMRDIEVLKREVLSMTKVQGVIDNTGEAAPTEFEKAWDALPPMDKWETLDKLPGSADLVKDMLPQPGDDQPVNDKPGSPTWGQLFGRKEGGKP